jgi:hypothetical protein
MRVCQFRHDRKSWNYFFAGAGTGCCFAAGEVAAGADFLAGALRSNTVPAPPLLRDAKIDNVRDVHINTIAEIVVALESNVADPRGPKAVCDPMPPNAPAKSAALPLWSSTTMIRKMHTRT